MRRSYLIAAGIAAAVLVVSLVGWLATNAQTAQVQAGERVVCQYDHVVSEDIQTLEVPAEDAANYSVETRTITCPDHLRAEAAYREAQDAIEKADLKKAEKKLAEVVAIDETFKRAKAQLDQIASGKKPSTDGATDTASNSGSTSKPSSPGDKGKPSGPVASLAGWMPDTLTGYTAQKPIADAFAISREYLPKSDDRIRVLVISAEQYGSADMAKAACERDVRLPYNGKAIKVGGHPGWIGTDRTGVAVLGITDGAVRVIFQISTEGTDPAKMTSELTKIAEGLPR